MTSERGGKENEKKNQNRIPELNIQPRNSEINFSKNHNS